MTTYEHITKGGGASRRSDAAEARIAMLKRFAGCMFGAFVLALMVGTQEGTQDDFGYAFRKSVLAPRIGIFALIGVAAFLAVTFWPRIVPYLNRSGVRPLAAGALTVVVSFSLLNWTDSTDLDNGKFGGLRPAAADTGGIDPLARVFFGSLFSLTPWLLLIIVVLLVGAAIRIEDSQALGYVGGGLAILFGVWAQYSQAAVRSFLNYPDHSTGAGVALLGFLTIGVSGIMVARSRASADGVDATGFFRRAYDWRPAMPLVALAAVLGLVSLFSAAWFSPTDRNAGIGTTSSMFSGTGLGGLSAAYIGWLAYVVFFAALVLAGAASYLRQTGLGWAAAGVGTVGLLLTLYVLHDFSGLAAQAKFDGATGAWDNLGTGGWMMSAALMILAGAGFLVARHDAVEAPSTAPGVPVSSDATRGAGSKLGPALMVVVIAAALFYPPTATQFWQTVLVTEIGIYVLLAIGLNVVVGWAGLLDLGFIAFYAIGSYTTAYLTDRLPVHPPSFLHLTPLAAIPFAIVICLLAGVLLGAPTLRLRGDYLAIVTLGFGEIIRVVANNSTPITNGSRGAFNIPPPEIHLGPLDIRWGDSALGFWYLLLVFVVIVVLLFNRLEHSRLGRAWAAIREDEVAAQATGINTTRVKLLAFAIGASTSGVAGVYFASQIGSFTPENFILNNSILVVAYVVFGGMGSLPGAMAGAAVLTWLPEFLRDQVPAEDRQMWIGAVILLMMIFRPGGLIPARRRRAELSGLDGTSSAETKAVPSSEGV